MWRYVYTIQNDLYHSGIKGQKWGVRRFQNSDGTLTPEGKIRYGSGAGDRLKNAASSVAKKVSDHYKSRKEDKRIKKLMKKPYKYMTEDEMAEVKRRLEKLNEIKTLRLEIKNKNADLKKKNVNTNNNNNNNNTVHDRFKKVALDIVESIGSATIKNLGTQAANHFGGEAINKVFKVSSDDTQHRIVNPQKGQSDKK